MNYGDHNFIEIKQQTKLRVDPVEPAEHDCRVSRSTKSSESSRAVRQCRRSQMHWLNTLNVSSWDEPSGIWPKEKNRYIVTYAFRS